MSDPNQEKGPLKLELRCRCGGEFKLDVARAPYLNSAYEPYLACVRGWIAAHTKCLEVKHVA